MPATRSPGRHGLGVGIRLQRGARQQWHRQQRVPVRCRGDHVTAVAAGFDTGYALKADGTVWAWGYGNNGQLGNNSSAKRLVPVQVSGLSNVTAVAGGGWTGYALRRDGTVWAWGNGSEGELGNDSMTGSDSPVQVSGLTNVTAIGGGAYTGYALRSDGTVRAWGFGNDGQLGNGGTATSTVPVQVSGLSSVTAIAAGGWSGYALRSDGSVWALGLRCRRRAGQRTDRRQCRAGAGVHSRAGGRIAAGAFTGYVLIGPDAGRDSALDAVVRFPARSLDPPVLMRYRRHGRPEQSRRVVPQDRPAGGAVQAQAATVSSGVDRRARRDDRYRASRARRRRPRPAGAARWS